MAAVNIRALYRTLEWYSHNQGVGNAARILQYYDLWKDLHTLSVNISKEGWEALKKLAQQNLGIPITNREQQWRFLFAIETYLNILIRTIALSKLGRTPSNLIDFKNKINNNRNIFSPSVFEWFFLAIQDAALDNDIKQNLENSITIILQTLQSINVATLSFDSFRVLYQNILPREIRRSLGEFYTNEEVVDQVLDAAGLNCERIRILYERWKAGHDVRILDPACGSGSFLVRLINRIFNCLGCKQDIVDFIESVLYGVDINPFAAEMAKINVILSINDGLQATCRHAVYAVQRINVFWGDSLATALEAKYPSTGDRVLKLRIPSLARFLESTNGEILLPPPDVTDPVETINEIVSYLMRNRRREDFIHDYLSNIPDDIRETYKDVLTSLWNIISLIIASGNSRAIELLKSSLRILRHMGQVDYIIGNPPWVRIHEVSKPVRERLRSDFRFYKQGSSYDPKFRRTRTPFKSQQDYSMAFVERGLDLLKPGGVLSFVITSKILKTTYAGKLREALLKETSILRLIDYSLYPIPLFEDVVNYPLVISVKKSVPPKDHKVDITIYNTAGQSREFHVMQGELPIDKKNLMSPWIIAPESVIQVFRKLQSRGVRLGDSYEIMRGVMTSANDLFIIREIKSCNKGIARVVLENGKEIEVEEWLIHPMVRGEDIDPFMYKPNYYIIFPHDPQTMEPLWDPVQHQILDILGLLSTGWSVKASGNVLVYETRKKSACRQVLQRISYFSHGGWTLRQVRPCRVQACIEVGKGNSTLKVNVESLGSGCKVYIEGLQIPGAPRATRHFIRNLERLVRRNDYRVNLPPWSIFRVSRRKFQEYRIAWQEIAKHFEATHLPVRLNINLCKRETERLIVPIQKVYFISDKNKCASLAMLAYLNSSLIRSLMKLIAWSARGGYYEHISYTVGQLPLPSQDYTNKLCEELKDIQDNSLNEAARNLTEQVERVIIKLLGVSSDEYEEVVSFGTWLNEILNNNQENDMLYAK